MGLTESNPPDGTSPYREAPTGRHPYVRYWLPVVLWLMVIAVLSTDFGSRSTTEGGLLAILSRWAPEWAARLEAAVWLDAVAAVLRQIGHFVEYGVLGLLGGRAVWRTTCLAPWAAVASTTVGAAGVAVLDELNQAATLTRTGSVVDVLTDAAGAFIAVAILVAVEVRRTPRSP